MTVCIYRARRVPGARDSQGQAPEPLTLENLGREGGAHTKKTLPLGEGELAHTAGTPKI